MLLTVNIVSAQTSTRWKPLFADSEYRWDSESARKIDNDTVRFWYENPFSEEQRNFFVKKKIYTQAEANTIAYGRVGVVAKCKSMQYGLFSGSELNVNKNPLQPGENLPLNKVKMTFIEPETNIEGFVIAVCKHLKMK